jgi:hypothetical protein
MNHQQSERAERESEKEKVREQIRDKEIARGKNPTGDTSGDCENAYGC